MKGLFPCIRPQGAFYLFPDISGYLHAGETSGDFVTRILEKTAVAVVPGNDFGMDGHVRICYAAPDDQLLDAFKKEGTAMTTRENVHRMAEANKAFAHFAW